MMEQLEQTKTNMAMQEQWAKYLERFYSADYRKTLAMSKGFIHYRGMADDLMEFISDAQVIDELLVEHCTLDDETKINKCRIELGLY